MLKGIDANEVFEFVTKGDTGEKPTKFLIANISNRKKLELFTSGMDKDGNVDLTKLQDKAFDILIAGLKAIKNLDGVDYDPVTEEVLEKLPITVLAELIAQILAHNFLSEGEAKN
jgi:hypothetical protein